MPTLIAGVLALYLLLVGIRRFAQLSPASAAAMVRNAGAVAVFVIAGFLLLRGNFAGAATLAAVATSLGLVGRGGRLGSVLGAVGFGPRPGRVTTARSATIEMRLDQDSGAVSGTVLAGAMQGRGLDTLTRGECLALYEDCRREDPEGARLLDVSRPPVCRLASGRRGSGRGAAAERPRRRDDARPGVSSPGLVAGRERRGNHSRPPVADAEASSRPWRVDRFGGSGQRSQGRPAATRVRLLSRARRNRRSHSS